MLRAFCLLLSITPLYTEIVDRIAITVDHQVITELQVDEELRVTEFLNRSAIVRNSEARVAAADRLVAQLLVQREMLLSRFPEPGNADVDKYLNELSAQFGSNQAYTEALREYQLTEPVLRQHLANQLATLNFIELRFRPSLDVPESEIRSFYDHEISTWETDHPNTPKPNFEAARPGILKLLLEEHTNRILDTWLEEARKQVDITYLDKSLQ